MLSAKQDVDYKVLDDVRPMKAATYSDISSLWRDLVSRSRERKDLLS